MKRSFGESTVRHFFHMNMPGSPISLERKCDLLGDRFPSGTLPIGCDSFGNYVLLRCGGDRDGEVLFWDHEVDEDEAEPTMVLAASFTAFANDLTDENE